MLNSRDEGIEGQAFTLAEEVVLECSQVQAFLPVNAKICLADGDPPPMYSEPKAGLA